MTRAGWNSILLAAIAMIDLALLGVGIDSKPFRTTGLAYGALAGQVGLMAIWLALAGKPSWPIRLSITAPAVIGLAYVASAGSASRSEAMAWGIVFFTQLVLSTTAVRSMRGFGLRLVDRNGGEVPQPASLSSKQISIRDIMILTAAISVVAAALGYAQPNAWALFQRLEAFMTIGQLALCLAVVTTVAVIATWAFDRLVGPVIVGMITAVACGYVLAISLARGPDSAVFTFLVGAAAIFQIVVLCAYRKMGLRLVTGAAQPRRSVRDVKD